MILAHESLSLYIHPFTYPGNQWQLSQEVMLFTSNSNYFDTIQHCIMWTVAVGCNRTQLVMPSLPPLPHILITVKARSTSSLLVDFHWSKWLWFCIDWFSHTLHDFGYVWIKLPAVKRIAHLKADRNDQVSFCQVCIFWTATSFYTFMVILITKMCALFYF